MTAIDTTPHHDHLTQLAALEHGATTAAVFALFDALPPVALETMIGSWRGSGIATGHPLDGLLERFAWHGKRFDGPEGAHPLLFTGAGGRLFAINPAWLPLGLALRYPRLWKLPIMARLFSLVAGVLRTDKPRARLRMTAFRGVVSATMIYDALPINDVFRRVSPDVLLGIMDMRGVAQPFVFVLWREGNS